MSTSARLMTLLLSVSCGVSVANVYYAQPLLDALALEFGITHARVGMVIAATPVSYTHLTLPTIYSV